MNRTDLNLVLLFAKLFAIFKHRSVPHVIQWWKKYYSVRACGLASYLLASYPELFPLPALPKHLSHNLQKLLCYPTLSPFPSRNFHSCEAMHWLHTNHKWGKKKRTFNLIFPPSMSCKIWTQSSLRWKVNSLTKQPPLLTFSDNTSKEILGELQWDLVIFCHPLYILLHVFPTFGHHRWGLVTLQKRWNYKMKIPVIMR